VVGSPEVGAVVVVDGSGANVWLVGLGIGLVERGREGCVWWRGGDSRCA
jgi:hypothetical protein